MSEIIASKKIYGWTVEELDRNLKSAMKEGWQISGAIKVEFLKAGDGHANARCFLQEVVKYADASAM